MKPWGLFLFLFGFLIGDFAFAESWKNQSNSTVTMLFGFVVPKLEMTVEDKNFIGRKISFVPNSPGRAFVGFSYRWLGGSVSGAMPIEQESKRLMGESQANDWQFRFNFSKFTIETLYQQYKGYYIENTNEFQAKTETDPFLQFPDLSTEKMTVSVHYLVNWWGGGPESFSMSASFDQSAQQIESGYSFLLSGSANHNRFETPTTLVPASATGTYGNFENVRGGRLYSLSGGVGAGGAFVPYSKFFVSAVFILNVGVEYQTVDSVNSSSSNQVQNNEAHLKAALGYNGDDGITALALHVSNNVYNIENARVGFNTLNVGLHFGTRFKF